MKINNFLGDVTDISAKQEALVPTGIWILLEYVCYSEAERKKG